MRLLSELPHGHKEYTALASRVLAVLSVGVNGYRVYLDAVPGLNHTEEWIEVARVGAKQPFGLARVIARECFGYEPDIPYAR